MNDEQLQEAALSGVLDVQDDFLDSDFRQLCEQVTSNMDIIQATNFSESYIALRHEVLNVSSVPRRRSNED